MSDDGSGRGGLIGASRRRGEDLRLLTGRGEYADDFAPEGCCHAAIVRSPHAHAHLRGIDAAAAMALPGVLVVLDGRAAAEDDLRPIPHNPDWKGPPDASLSLPEGFEVYLSDNYPLALDRVRFVGESVAVVVAESAAIAADAADLVEVDYEPIEAVVEARDAMARDAPRLWPDCPENLAFTCQVGNREESDRAFASATHVVRFEGRVQRVIGNPMEPRAVIGEYDAARRHYTLRTASGRGAVQTRERLATVLGVPLENCRAVFGDMGGNFGTRNAFFPEYALIPWAARRVGRPVKYVASRQECFLSDYHARDLVSEAELALDAEGNFLALRGTNIVNLGAHTVYFWPLRKGLSMMQGVYRIPAVHFQGHAVLTNSMSTAVYRSAGRPEAIYMIERLIDLAAAECGFDRIELRRRNLIAPDQMPFTTAVGVTYDSGEYQRSMDRALEMIDWAGFSARRAEAAGRGRRRGIAVSNYIEVTSGIPRERAELIVRPDSRRLELVLGTMSSGQSHETTFPQVVGDWLGMPFEAIDYVCNDTERVSVGGGSHSGRSMRLASIAISEAVEDLLSRARPVAARLLQVGEEEISYAEGAFHGAGGGTVDLWRVASEMAEPLEGIGDITNRAGGYPYGTHACEVEVDPETGVFEIVAWIGVDDVGMAINPMVLHGQAHGAIAQGIGQAWMEAIRHDPVSGQLLSGSFLDYAMPRASDLPSFKTEIMEVPASSHPHGIRPGGEGGTTPALGLLVNAVVDALSGFGVRDLAMPLTQERVWRAIDGARSP